MTTPLHRRDYTPGAAGALDGVRILDMSRLFAGNILTQVLGDFGAEVIKIEPPEGDTLRAWRTEGVATNWKIYARNKKSLCLDLRNADACALVRDLVPSAAMFIESFRPGVLEKMGLAPQTLLAAQSRGWWSCAFRAGDRTARTASGPASARWSKACPASPRSTDSRTASRCCRRCISPTRVAGLYGASAAMIALREVEMNGGQRPGHRPAAARSVVRVLGPQAANYRLTGKVKPRTGSRSTNAAPRNAYRCKDGTLCRAVGLHSENGRARVPLDRPRRISIDNPRYRTNADRVKHAEELDAIIGAFIAERTQAENVAFFEQPRSRSARSTTSRRSSRIRM